MHFPGTDVTKRDPEPPGGDGLAISGETFEAIGNVLRNIKGFNLDIYKDKCIKRRIAIRMRATHSSSAEEYCNYLLRHEAEIDLLLKVLTIHVSQFFRNPATYEKLKNEIIPYLFSLCREAGRPTLHCWSVGCAGGEEPYSLALLFKESFQRELERTPLTILGTDVDSPVLEQAQRGMYGEERLPEVPPAILGRWFRPDAGKFVLDPEIRQMVEFYRSDLCDTDAFPRSDLILCRNVLIYLERQQQERIVGRFADVLRPGGILVLGKSETLVGDARRRFRTVCPIERIYRVV
jgi:chemotaxis protein methyltransferase CheR